MNNRYIGALIISPLIVFVFLGGWFLQALCLLLSIIGIYEFFKVAKNKGYKPVNSAAFIFIVVYYLLFIKYRNTEFLSPMIIIATLLLLCLPIIKSKYNYTDVAITILGLIYVPIFFSFIASVNLKEHGNILVWLVFLTSWGCDTFAYYIGKNFGKRKLSPKISPNKTLEGSIGGCIGSALLTVIFGAVIQANITYIMPLYHYAILGLIASFLSEFGDLVASSMKRYAGIKDFSNLIPGHGGILDRFDSILYSSVTIYYYLTFIVKL
ncbi:phosphatidate cytidylyltransferase [Clostridium oryzae]|uniref:Phosphatidate cytidylyltransferase n=1 Tax=Clostridium oryzae TaxID=1450648 RepID=A0A1V4IPG6_9CLOT|nr:phosphatidate cytidylyltransferase [Clostridium oryzae]OPJ61803.1 phosphatidate cytidylyltransferase [Clostridium oryzae]